MILTAPNTAIGPFVVGEKPAPLQYQFQDASGAPLPIVAYTVKFNVRERNGTNTVYNATLADGPNGIVEYTWIGGEFPTPGHWFAEFWVGNNVQRFCSVEITFNVRTPIGPVPNI
jgi:hypothetical protein